MKPENSASETACKLNSWGVRHDLVEIENQRSGSGSARSQVLPTSERCTPSPLRKPLGLSGASPHQNTKSRPRPAAARRQSSTGICPQFLNSSDSLCAICYSRTAPPITFHLSPFTLHPPRRSAQSTRKDANSGLEEKHSPNPCPVQNPKPSPNARPLMTQASVRFFLTCAVAS